MFARCIIALRFLSETIVSDKEQGGPPGADAFVFSPALSGGNVDTIEDFAKADDTIQLDRSAFAKLAQGELAEGAFRIGNSGAEDAGDRIILNPNSGRLTYDEDGTGNRDSVLVAMLDPGLAPTHQDFFAIA